MPTVRGSVLMQVGRIELLARHSMTSMQQNQYAVYHEDSQGEQERVSVTDREWNRKVLRDQFEQNDLESMYRKYYDKLKASYLSMFFILQILVSLTHSLILGLIVGIHNINDIIPYVCYTAQTVLTCLVIGIYFIKSLNRRYPKLRYILSIIILFILISTDILVPILTPEVRLRTAYSTHTLLACYVFLPVRNNYIAIFLGTLISLAYLSVDYMMTLHEDPSKYYKIAADFLYLVGVNFMGAYYRYMNEVVTRRSFLDRRDCINATFNLNFEKNQEERLLLSILPRHIAMELRHDLRKVFLKIRAGDVIASSPSFGLSNIYIKEHQNVSILYADVVNYTMITTTLHPKDLVETLNELFGRFDEASEEHEVLRIKFLGDCYYCVSGVPDPNPQHAKSCVDLGLDMISIIKDVRSKRNLNIDMRIGVHTGDVISGFVGMAKWQFDVWSQDVTIANKMESTGKPGKVHITRRTLDELGPYAKDYIIVPNYETSEDPLLSKHQIQTFLLTKPPKDHKGSGIVSFKRVAVNFGGEKGIYKKNLPPSIGDDGTRRRTTGFMDSNLVAYRQMLKGTDRKMAEEVEKMPSGLFKEFTDEDEINPFTLLYRKSSWEVSYLKEPDPLFKYFAASSLIIWILIFIIQVFTIEILEDMTIYIGIVIFTFLIIIQPLTWTQYIWTKSKGSEQPRSGIIKWLYNVSRGIVWSPWARCFIYLIIFILLVASSVENLIHCVDLGFGIVQMHHDGNKCIVSWHFGAMCALVLLLNFLSSRVFFLLKWIMGYTITGIYIWIVWDYKSSLFESSLTWNVGMDPRIAHTLAVGFLVFTLHFIDRQTEFRNRVDHRWKKQLTEEQDEALIMKYVNHMLLQNILPAHVANIYLNTNRSADELYHEEYSNVAVMFASLTDYRLCDDEDVELPEQTMLKVLDQLIYDFDRLLLDADKPLKVEKIKMAGWTYMAACGLDPSKIASFTSSMNLKNDVEKEYEDEVVKTMVEFAINMMEQLKEFNRSAFQTFRGTSLKIGISHGRITAGVVGSLKPLYDIWGDAVNMASRMDSTGVAGKIQVTENTAKVLDRQGILTEYRGETYVKNAGYAKTYFVPFDEEYNVIYKDILSNNNNEETISMKTD